MNYAYVESKRRVGDEYIIKLECPWCHKWFELHKRVPEGLWAKLIEVVSLEKMETCGNCGWEYRWIG